MDQERGKLLDVRELLWKARRYRWLALLPVVTALCGAFLYLKLSTPVYRSGVTVTLGDRTPVSQALEAMIRSDRERESMVEKVDRVKTRILNRSFLEAICERLGLTQSREVLLAAAAAVKKYPGVTPDEYAMRVAVAALSKKITVAPFGTRLIRIAVEDPAADKARHLAATITERLIEDTRRGTLERAQARGDFSEDQIAVYSENLRRSEDALQSYQESMIARKANVGPVTDDNVETVRQLIEGAQKEMDQVEGRILLDRGIWAQYGAGEEPPDLRGPATAEIESRLNSLETSFGVAATRRRESGTEAQSFLAQIGAVRQELLARYEAAAQALPGNLSPVARQLAAGVSLDRAVLRSLQARRDHLSGLRNDFLAAARGTPSEQMKLERLRNEVQTNRELLVALQREATSSRLSEALETSQMNLRVEVVEPPVLPLSPVWPDRKKILGAAILLGSLLSVGSVLVAERLGAIVRTVEQAEEELGTKVIGTVPRIEGWSRPGSFLQNHWAPISIAAVLLLTVLFYGVYSSLTQDKGATTTSGVLRR